MLSINVLGANQTELTANGIKVLFSYNTPVACWINGQFYKTNKRWSVTTSKHVNKWTHLAVDKEQSFFDGLVNKFKIERV